LQFEVVQHRLKNEYNVDAKLDKLPYTQARWVFGAGFDPKEAVRSGTVACLTDVEDRPILLFESEWMRRRFEDKNPTLTFVAAVQPGRGRDR
jgi:peptide chain release factor 3